VVAAGSGHRFGGMKQFHDLCGRPVASWSLTAARAATDGAVLVIPVEGDVWSGEFRDALGFGADAVVVGGATRAASVRAGLEAVPDDAAVIVVHDAVRPLADDALFAAVIDAVRSGSAAGAVPALAVSDTLKHVDAGVVTSTVDRQALVTVQTPQAFDAVILRRAHRDGGDATDDAGLLEQLGATVCTVPGDPHNVKVTRPEDLELAAALLAARSR
jgi:2-C-methyl-D-erythritol 4-phosphate cytidylyltransferase